MSFIHFILSYTNTEVLAQYSWVVGVNRQPV